MKAHFQTDQGQVRPHNEDAGGVFYNRTHQVLAVVADGMGGHQAGDVASRMAASFIQDNWEHTERFSTTEETETWLTENIQEANHTLLDYARNHETCAGMGTTAVAVVCTDEFLTVSHVGDSRCYKLDQDGFEQITEDHSLVNELVRSGQISQDAAEQHPRKNVLLKALGTETDITADIQSIAWKSGTKLLLCSDGLTDKLTDNELSSFLQKEQDPETIASDMIELANDRGGEDNISLVVLDHDWTGKEGES